MPTKPIIPAITAAEARKLAAERKALLPMVRLYLDGIHALIREAANSGETSLGNPLARLWRPAPEVEEMGAILAVLKVEGYSVSWPETSPLILTISWG